MVDVTKLRGFAKNLVEMMTAGQDNFAARYVVANLVHPILDLLNAMETNRGERWKTLSEAIRESAKARNYFEKPLASLGGRCRLEAWAEEGFADQTEEGLWLVSPIKVAEATGVGETDDEQIPAGEAKQDELDVEAFADELTRIA